MNKTMRAIVGVIATIIIVVAVFFTYIWFAGGTGEPSTDIDDAIVTLEVNAPSEEATIEASTETDTSESTEATEIPATESTEETPAEATEQSADTQAANTSQEIVFQIVSDNSEAKFELDEDLRGERATAIGTTNQIAGQILINFDNPQDSQLGTIRVNARTLETDQAFRNRALRAEILKSSQDQYEFIDFEPTALNGLPDSVEIGGTYNFEIVGNLTIVGVTKEVSFTATVTLDSETQISGTASTTVLRSDYGIVIPNVPGVANVEDEVVLTLNFVATAEE